MDENKFLIVWARPSNITALGAARYPAMRIIAKLMSTQHVTLHRSNGKGIPVLKGSIMLIFDILEVRSNQDGCFIEALFKGGIHGKWAGARDHIGCVLILEIGRANHLDNIICLINTYSSRTLYDAQIQEIKSCALLEGHFKHGTRKSSVARAIKSS
jgi:hypothetical protein